MYGRRMYDWSELSEKILIAMEQRQAEFLAVAQLEEDEERQILSDTVAYVLAEEEANGRLHPGPAQD